MHVYNKLNAIVSDICNYSKKWSYFIRVIKFNTTDVHNSDVTLGIQLLLHNGVNVTREMVMDVKAF